LGKREGKETDFREARGHIKGHHQKKPESLIRKAHQQQPFYRKDDELFLEGLLTISKLAFCTDQCSGNDPLVLR
jgi:hypothetical protein